jgi:hypothetical protein
MSVVAVFAFWFLFSAALWVLFVACSELEVRESDRLFFCGQGQSRLANQARAICASCDVQGECLEFALRNPRRASSGSGAGPRRDNAGSYGRSR